MGDTQRNIQLASFIVKRFPKVKTILVIADGKGELSRKLANKGFIVRVIEAKPRWEGKPHKNVTYQKGWFSAETEIKEDIIIGMHPDEATGEILLAAKQQGKPFAVVPCCAVGRYSENMNQAGYKQWIKKLKEIFKCQEWDLHISGRSTVLFNSK